MSRWIQLLILAASARLIRQRFVSFAARAHLKSNPIRPARNFPFGAPTVRFRGRAQPPNQLSIFQPESIHLLHVAEIGKCATKLKSNAAKEPTSHSRLLARQRALRASQAALRFLSTENREDALRCGSNCRRSCPI